jgi:hypothetical protein
MEENILRTKWKFLIIGSKAKNQISRFCRRSYLAALNCGHMLAKMYMNRAQKVGHEGTSSTSPRSRQHIWIIE